VQQQEAIPMAERDAVQADPQHYTVAAEDDRVRVLRARYGAGEKSDMHAHPAVVAIFVTAAHARFSLEDGSTEEAQGQAGDTLLMPATNHSVENLGTEPFEVILVELKG
jgi:quercetin dioxygenase-like cupin family protein